MHNDLLAGKIASNSVVLRNLEYTVHGPFLRPYYTAHAMRVRFSKGWELEALCGGAVCPFSSRVLCIVGRRVLYAGRYGDIFLSHLIKKQQENCVYKKIKPAASNGESFAPPRPSPCALELCYASSRSFMLRVPTGSSN